MRRDEIPPGTLYLLILKSLARAGEMHGYEMRKRLEELSGRKMEPYLLVNEHGKEAEVFDSTPDEIIARGDYMVQRAAASGRR